MRRIGVVTVGRSDWGIYLPVVTALRDDPEFQVQIIAAGAHLVPAYGHTVEAIQAHGFEVAAQVEMLLASDNPVSIAKSMGLGVLGFADVYERLRPDLLLVLGDRFEMHAAAVASVPFQIPLAHIHGGEVTHGAIDEAFRHAITKYAHLHFASTQEHADRIVQLGEAPWRVTVSGAPSLDNLKRMKLLSRADLEARLQLPFTQPPLLVTFHPVTLQYEQVQWQILELLSALAEFEGPIVVTQPNADTNNQVILRHIREFAARHAHTRVVDSLGTQAYFSLMKYACAMVGNSSSGIIEAASFDLPVVNLGIRQAGRPRSGNVIDVGHDRAAIRRALQQATDPDFRRSLQGLQNLYGAGDAADRIAARLKQIPLDDHLLIKRFHDLPRELQPCNLLAV